MTLFVPSFLVDRDSEGLLTLTYRVWVLTLIVYVRRRGLTYHSWNEVRTKILFVFLEELRRSLEWLLQVSVEVRSGLIVGLAPAWMMIEWLVRLVCVDAWALHQGTELASFSEVFMVHERILDLVD